MTTSAIDWAALAQASQMLCRAATESHLLELAIDTARDTCGAEAAAIWLYDPAGGRLQLAQQDGLDTPAATRPQWAGLFKLPLNSGRALIGVLEAYTSAEAGFETEVEQALRILGGLVAAAVHRLRESARADASRGTVVDRERLTELELLWGLTEATGHATNHRELFEAILTRLPGLVPFDAAVLLTLSGERPEGLVALGAAGHLGLIPAVLARAQEALARAGGVCERIDESQVKVLTKPAATAGEAVLRHGFGLPLTRQGEAVGVIYVASVGDGAYEPQQIAALHRFGSLASASLDRLQRHQAVEIERLATIIYSVPQGVVLLDAVGRVLMINSPGRTRLALLNGDDAQVTALGATPLVELVDEAIASGVDLTRREIELRSGSQIHHFSTTVVAVRDARELVGTVLSIEDVTELRQTEQRLFHDARLASIGEFASGLAHELNNPMMIILGTAEVLADDPGISEEKQGLLDEMQLATLRAAEIVKQLMIFADQQQDEGWDTLDLHEVLREALELVLSQCERDGVTVSLAWDEAAPPVQGNAGKLQQIVLSLLRNAYEAIIQSGTGSSIVIRSRAGRDAVYVEVADDGPGVPPELRARIFDVFFTTKRDYQGKGLGLSIAHRLAIEHGGDLGVTDRPGGGSIFRLTLPIER